MKPCSDISLDHATPAEMQHYAEFVERYSRLWEEYFDPVGIRIKLTPASYRLETVILPLVRNSIYEGLLGVLSDDATPLNANTLPGETVLGVAARLDKQRLIFLAMNLADMPPGWEPDAASYTEEAQRVIGQLTEEQIATALDEQFASWLSLSPTVSTWGERFGFGDFLLKGLGDEVGFYVCDARPNFSFNWSEFAGRILSRGGFDAAWMGSIVSSVAAPVYVTLSVQDRDVVDEFLRRMDPWVARMTQHEVDDFIPIRYHYSISQLEGHAIRSLGMDVAGIGLRCFVTRLDDTLYIASQVELVRELIDANRNQQPSEPPGGTAESGHLQAWMWPQLRKQSEASESFQSAAADERACHHNLAPLTEVARAGFGDSIDDTVDKAYLRDGVRYACPSGGRYVYEINASEPTVKCTLHGSVLEPRQPLAPPEASNAAKLSAELGEIEASVKLTPEGLRAVLTIQRHSD